MKRQSGRVIIILVLVILVAVLPAQADRGGQSGGSSPIDDHGAQVNAAAGSSAAAFTESAAKAPATDSDRSFSLQSVVQAGSGVVASDAARGLPSATAKSMQAVMANTQSGSAPLSGPSGDFSGRSAVSNNGRADAAGGAGSPQRSGGEDAAGMPDPASGMGSPQRTGEDNAAGIPDAQGKSGESGRMAGTIRSTGAIAVTRFASYSGTGTAPGPGAGHGPSPQRQQRGPPADSTSYPCGPAQPTPLPPAAGTTRDESKEENLPRQRSRRGVALQIPDTLVPEPAAPTVPPQALFPLNMLLLGGFRRISRKNVLEQDARQVIYQTITATPGTDVKTLAGMTGINENTLRYHIDRLVATRKITSFTRPGIVRYFQNPGVYSPYEHRVFHYLRTDTPCGILRLLHQNAGLTRQHIADALMIAGPSVTRQMDNLIADGIVENRFPGRSNHYYLTTDAALAIEKLMKYAGEAMRKDTDAIPIAASA